MDVKGAMTQWRETYCFQGRLAQFAHSAAQSASWDERWRTIDLAQQYKWAEQGALGVYRQGFMRYLPQSGLILEAGCGTGRYVRALTALGYQVIGLDWAIDTLQRAKSVWSSAPLAAADVRSLPLAPASAVAIISLGVIEHFFDPWEMLRDSMRVLKSGGILYLVVPQLNPLRRWFMRRGKYPTRSDATDFYQYFLDAEEINRELTDLGMEVLIRYPTSGYAGLVDAWPRLDRWVRRLPQANRLINGLNRSRLLGLFSGHVIHFVARKL